MTEGQEKSTPQPELVRAIERFIEELPTGGLTSTTGVRVRLQQILALRSVAGGEPEQWISVEERLPEFDKVVLTFSHEDGCTPYIEAMSCCEFEGKIEWYEQDGDSWGNIVTHWMPLPAPPQGKPLKESSNNAFTKKDYGDATCVHGVRFNEHCDTCKVEAQGKEPRKP